MNISTIIGPEETVLRSLRAGDRDHWHGCQAGKYVMGIESDGAVKGCPSLQTPHYVGGNLRERDLAAIWKDAPELAWNRGRTVDALWGFCRTCDFAEDCLGIRLHVHRPRDPGAARQQLVLSLPRPHAGQARASASGWCRPTPPTACRSTTAPSSWCSSLDASDPAAATAADTLVQIERDERKNGQ